MGWALKPAKLTYPKVTETQTTFLIEWYNRPGKISHNRVYRDMERVFSGKEILAARRIKNWMSRYHGMVKKDTFTKNIQAVRDQLDADEAADEAAVAGAGAGAGAVAGAGARAGAAATAASDLDVREWGCSCCSNEDDHEKNHTKCPPPKAGFQHQPSVSLVDPNALNGRRIQHQFDDGHGWVDGIIRGVSLKKDKRARATRPFVTVEFSDVETLEIQLWESEYGTKSTSRWVLWNGSRPTVVVPENWALLQKPVKLDSDYLKKLVNTNRGANATTKLVYLWDTPQDWHLSTFLSYKKSNKGEMKEFPLGCVNVLSDLDGSACSEN